MDKCIKHSKVLGTRRWIFLLSLSATENDKGNNAAALQTALSVASLVCLSVRPSRASDFLEAEKSKKLLI